MSSPELRRAMRQRRAELRQEFGRAKARAKALLREQLGRNPVLQARARRRRRRKAVMTAIGLLLALLLLRSCTCAEVPLPPGPSGRDAGTVVDAGFKVRPAVRPPVTAPRIGLQRRGDLKLGDTAALTWLDEFRLQVAARGPKLANCFQGADRPGALRWTTALNPASGQVSAHELEPMGGTGLNQTQRECLLGVLSQPRYQLRERPDGGSSTAPRVSIMLEF